MMLSEAVTLCCFIQCSCMLSFCYLLIENNYYQLYYINNYYQLYYITLVLLAARARAWARARAREHEGDVDLEEDVC